MKRHLVFLVGGFYPNGSNPMGVILGKLCSSLTKRYDVSILSVRQLNVTTKPRYIYEGADVRTMSSWWHDWRDSKGLLGTLKRVVITVLCKGRAIISGGTSQDYFADMALKSLAKLYTEKPFQCIISLSFPFQLHLAGKRFTELHPNVGFITYSTDTHSDNINSTRVPLPALRKLVSLRRRRIELNCYTAADFNFFSREIFTTQKSFLHAVLSKSDYLDYVMAQPKTRTATKVFEHSKINLLFAGRVDPTMRDPTYFANLILALPDDLDIRLHLYLVKGSSDFFPKSAPLNGKVVFHKPISPLELYERMCQADVLVNLDNNSDVFMPSKLFDYVSTGKPIINVRYKDRPLNRILSRYPVVLDLVNYACTKDDTVRLARFCLDAKGRSIPKDEILSLYHNHTCDAVSKRLSDKIDSIISKHSNKGE